MAFAACTVLTTSTAPSRRDLGTLHGAPRAFERTDASGLVQTCMSAVRTVSPALSSTIFALSVDKHALGGQLIWVTLVRRCNLPRPDSPRPPSRSSASRPAYVCAIPSRPGAIGSRRSARRLAPSVTAVRRRSSKSVQRLLERGRLPERVRLSPVLALEHGIDAMDAERPRRRSLDVGALVHVLIVDADESAGAHTLSTDRVW